MHPPGVSMTLKQWLLSTQNKGVMDPFRVLRKTPATHPVVSIPPALVQAEARSIAPRGDGSQSRALPSAATAATSPGEFEFPPQPLSWN